MSDTQRKTQIPMEVDVKIFRTGGKGPVLANASVSLNGCFAIRGSQIREGKHGPFVSMPAQKVKSGYRDICFPCTAEFKRTFDRAVLGAYRMELEQGAGQRQNAAPEQEGPEMGGMSM